MDITPIIPEDRQVIDSYGPGRFQIAGVVYLSPVIVFPNQVFNWPLEDFNDLTGDDLNLIREAEPKVEVLLLGSGEKGYFLKPSLKRQIVEKIGIGFDIMDTGAACRTYNILLAEGRRVAAALLPI